VEHLKYDLGTLEAGSVVSVALKHRANVLLMDASNYRIYSAGRGGRFSFLGGEALRSPLRLRVPHLGHWFVALDLGGAAGRISASVSVQDPS
jgi:hypothetical protein